ncbi:MAG TPA: 16S rRNA (cytosine(967)-C(5))-methyltransferase RsmB, partial [Clostridiales bacterium]|nr:16S rRNA (cytosine(967)-C(5))-methyltransferase RsmB [Clostridiales bacterium]
ENADLVREFLQAHAEFTLEKQRYTDPEAGGGESYYYARMRKQ